MSLSSDNFTAIIYLRDKVRKWKNLSYLMIIAFTLLSFRALFGDNYNNQSIEVGEYIAQIKIDGVIFEDDHRTKILERIATQKNIKAVLVRIDSPGGGIFGSENLYNSLKEIAKNKPIVVVMESIATSGAYMAAIASDYIIARNGTLTGSIGVIMQSSEVTELAKKVGVKFLNYKSSSLKGSPSPFEKTNPAVDKAINETVKDSYRFFANLVKKSRGNKLKNPSTTLNGRVFTGRQALKVGLIDKIGGKQQGLEYLKSKHQINIEKLSIKEIKLIKDEENIFSNIAAKTGIQDLFSKIVGKSNRNNGLMSIWEL